MVVIGIAVGETRNARAFDYRCLYKSAGGRVVLVRMHEFR